MGLADQDTVLKDAAGGSAVQGTSSCCMDPHPPLSRPVHCPGNMLEYGAYQSARRPWTEAERGRMGSGMLHIHNRYSVAVAAVVDPLRVGNIGPDVVTQDPSHRPATADPYW